MNERHQKQAAILPSKDLDVRALPGTSGVKRGMHEGR
jgi:hypothetical protein